ncbi:hypothetical protein KUTeg_025052 [Tegillarca granosa]|uniref:EF-hand domain-containing protein n=1 Tax=Tegillarca granosa TaxID=220873 RepID=A0ABQ9DZ52_TEGGR|nr:hypothetical protein KUTeg_025052 [Tegillarca granosa]
MEVTLELVLPWRTLRSKLAKCDSDGTVLYHTTFEEMKLCHRYSEVLPYLIDFITIWVRYLRLVDLNGPSLTEMLYRNRENLGSLFRLIDKDNSGCNFVQECSPLNNLCNITYYLGCISMEEFEEALLLLIKHQNITINHDQIKDIARSIDLNKDGVIDFNEFLEAFRIVDQYGTIKSPRKGPSTESIELGSCMLGGNGIETKERKVSKTSMLQNVSEDIKGEMEC